jgi:hypothetical protein
MSSVGSCGRRGPPRSRTRNTEVTAAEVGLEKNAWSTLAWAAASAHYSWLKCFAVAAHSPVAARRAAKASPAIVGGARERNVKLMTVHRRYKKHGTLLTRMAHSTGGGERTPIELSKNRHKTHSSNDAG